MKNLQSVSILFLLGILSLNGFGQDDGIIEVMGETKVKVLPDSLIVELFFEENGRTCGPNTNFETVGEQAAFFFNELKNADVEYKANYKELDRLEDYINGYQKLVYSFIVKDEEMAKKIYDIGVYSFAEKVNFFYKYPPYDEVDDMDVAIRALEDAQMKAEELMKKFGKSSIELIYIDDYTSGSLGIRPYFSVDKAAINYNNKRAITMTYYLKVKYRLL